MSDAATNRIIDGIVAEYVRTGQSFTAAQVVAEARVRGFVIGEAVAAERLRQLFQEGVRASDDTFTIIDVNASVAPIVFYPQEDAPAQLPAGGAISPPERMTQPKRSIWEWLRQLLFGSASANPLGPADLSPIISSSGIFAQPISARTTPVQPTGPAAPSPTKPNVPRTKTLNLEAGQFLPIKREELVSAAKGIRLWGSAWFGRRDLIPPADDPRTNLIDRALVTNGLLSPEQLAEIHQVGAEMDRVRPDLIHEQRQARLAGEAAVEADRIARAKVKEQKKAEAAEKRRRKAEDVERRKTTDIIFLGRGVSSRLVNRTSDTAQLVAFDLPVLSTPGELAAALNIAVPQLRWLAFHAEVASRTHYVYFNVPKKSGGVRTLSAPHKRLAAAQQWILRNILDKLPVEGDAHGFIGGRNIVTNARPHVGKQVVINMDLESFFPSITFPRVRSVFQGCGYSPAVATILALLCTECPRRQVQYSGQPYFVATGPRGLPQGACTSPALSNQVARRLDKRLAGLAAKFGIKYTRYADDLSLSGNDELSQRVGYVMARVRHIANDEGFIVNEKKTRILRRNTAQKVTGIVVNERPNVSRVETRQLRAILHNARQQGLAAQNREGRSNFLAWLRGKIAFVKMAQPDLGDKLLQEFNEILQNESLT